MNIRNNYIFYHIYDTDRIDEIVLEQVETLKNSGLLNNSKLFTTILSNSKKYISDNTIDIIQKNSEKVFFENGNVFEIITQKHMYDYCKTNIGKFLYMHTKGCTRINHKDQSNYSYRNIENWRHIIGDEIRLNVKEILMNLGYKTLECFEIIKDMDFDYVFKTNTSSYIDIKLLCDFIQDKPINNFYCGIIGIYNNISFVSGCGCLLSKDLLLKVLQHKNHWNHNYIEDVSLGDLMMRLNIKPSQGYRFDIVDDYKDIPIDYYHYRCKDSNNRNNDIIRMEKIKELKNKL